MLGRKQMEAPDHLFQPTYQNSLRAVGRYLDSEGLKAATILEVEGGYVLRAVNPQDPSKPQAIELPQSDLQGLVLRNFTARGTKSDGAKSTLCPTGYEDFLRALGHELDRAEARGVAVHEMPEAMVVTYLKLQSRENGYMWQPKGAVLTAEQIYTLLNEAFNRRTDKNR